MGTVKVAVGCPHRLRRPIGPRTAHPCQQCAAIGLPGWPRLAWAMTVDYGPRLSAAATRATAAPPAPRVSPEAVRAVHRAFRGVSTAFEQMAEPMHRVARTMSDAVRNMPVIEVSPLRIEVRRPSDHADLADMVRYRARQEMRVRFRD